MTVAGYMLDTNVFNSVRDGALALRVFDGLIVYTTHIQQNELNGTRDPYRKAELLKVFRAIDAVALPTESAVWGIYSASSKKRRSGLMSGALPLRRSTGTSWPGPSRRVSTST